jgi:hypothetical protein
MLQMPTCMLRSQHAILQKSHVNIMAEFYTHVAKLQHACCKISTWRFKHPNMHVTDMNINVTDTSMHVTDASMVFQNSNMHGKFLNIMFQRLQVPTCMLTSVTCMLRHEHACYRCEHGKISVYLSPQKQEHHRHPTVPTHETRQIPTHNTLVCASRTNNTYTLHALPRKILCQAGTSPKSHCPPAPAW